jgi:small subunit ribosomal protein S16
MLVIRLKRTGRRNDPSFKIVVGEKIFSPKSGKHYSYLGSYNPKTKSAIIDAEAVKGWIAKGAQPSGTVHNLLITKGIIEGKKVNVLPKKTVPKKDEPEAPKAEAPTAAPQETASAAEPVNEEAFAPEEAK